MKLELLLGSSALAVLAFSTLAMAEPLDLDRLDGTMLSEAEYEALVAAARENSPPNDGVTLTIGFANLSRDIVFTQLVERSILENGERAGIEVIVADNQLDGPTALSVAQGFAQREVDAVIEFQLDVNFGPAIMDAFNEIEAPVVAIDIPMPGAMFFGVNNPQSGFIAGTYLASAAMERFGEEIVRENGVFVVGELTQSGAVLGMRSHGQRAGVEAVLDLPKDRVVTLDTTASIEQAFSQMNSVLARIPADAPIMVTANNDQSVIGMLRAISAAGRGDMAIGVGMGSDEIETMMATPNMVGSVAFFPERYGNWVVPLSLAQLAGQDLPEALLINHVVVNKTNVCEYYGETACAEADPFVSFQYDYPEEAFDALLEEIKADPRYAESLDVLPQ
ncbi:MAG: substrate-binding domain-containing protein [Hyphomonas sp.]|nr:substrate-binding domain-containing protein [Hyphomonas sp.]